MGSYYYCFCDALFAMYPCSCSSTPELCLIQASSYVCYSHKAAGPGVKRRFDEKTSGTLQAESDGSGGSLVESERVQLPIAESGSAFHLIQPEPGDVTLHS